MGLLLPLLSAAPKKLAAEAAPANRATGSPMTALSFRNATLADVDVLVPLVTSAYRGESSRAGWTTEADFLDGNRIDADVLRADIARPRSRVVLAERSGAPGSGPGQKLLACAHVADEDGHGYFGMFAVVPDLQGAGVGKALLAECERIAREEWGLPDMRMTVIDIRDELIAFYERRGYRRTGTYKPFPHGDERFGVPKRDDLRFEVLEKAL